MLNSSAKKKKILLLIFYRYQLARLASLHQESLQCPTPSRASFLSLPRITWKENSFGKSYQNLQSNKGQPLFLNNQLSSKKKPFKHVIDEVLTFFGLTSYNKIGCNQIQNPTRVQGLPNIWLVFLIHCMFVKRELPKKENELIFSAEITLPQMLRCCFCTKLILR